MRKIGSKLFGPDENGKFYEYFDGYADSSEMENDPPIDGVADGSNVIATDNGDWYFFNEKTQSWNIMLSIAG